MLKDNDLVLRDVKKELTEQVIFIVTPEEKELLESGKKNPRIGDVFSDVADFIEVFEQDVQPQISIPEGKLLDLRMNLIEEELDEIKSSIEDNDLAEYVDGCIDLIYVVAGALLATGISAEDCFNIWNMVHSANMAKVGGPIDENGKKLKPEGWKPPDVEGKIQEILSRK